MARLVWAEREQPLLEAIRDLEDEARGALQNDPIGEVAELPPLDVALGLEALLDGGYIYGEDMRGIGGPGVHLIGARLAPAGRVKVRQWPGDDAAAALLEALDEAAGRAEGAEEQGAIEQTKRGVRGLPSRLIEELAVAYAKRLSGLE